MSLKLLRQSYKSQVARKNINLNFGEMAHSKIRFRWAASAVAALAKPGFTAHQILERLHKLPKGLEGIYRFIYDQIKAEGVEVLRVCNSRFC